MKNHRRLNMMILGNEIGATRIKLTSRVETYLKAAKQGVFPHEYAESTWMSPLAFGLISPGPSRRKYYLTRRGSQALKDGNYRVF